MTGRYIIEDIAIDPQRVSIGHRPMTAERVAVRSLKVGQSFAYDKDNGKRVYNAIQAERLTKSPARYATMDGRCYRIK